jgi:hypothetical protein
MRARHYSSDKGSQVMDGSEWFVGNPEVIFIWEMAGGD